MTSYICPRSRDPLKENKHGLLNKEGKLYPFILGVNETRIPNFLHAYSPSEMTKRSLEMYDQQGSGSFYRNFLDWLFQTFQQEEHAFRENLIQKLNLLKGDKVLVTGCGLGDDIAPMLELVGETGEIYANDLAPHMVVSATSSQLMQHRFAQIISFSVCDACLLPFSNGFFNAAYHFGGINLFDNIKQAISEMNRVVKPGSRVVFGDEGVAPWLKSTDYAKMVIANNPLWAAQAPIDLLPEHATDVHISWVLGNCFYIIDFQVSDSGPKINVDIMHKGRRGGSMRTRYLGQLEGVTEQSKKFVLEDAAKRGISVHE